MVVPSFSMFQLAILAKAKALNSKPLELVPTYDYVKPKKYNYLKSIGLTPFTLYLPEKNTYYRYNSVEGKFRTEIDGHPGEKRLFAGALHDVYHAFREMQMKSNIRDARVRLASIAKSHPDNNPANGDARRDIHAELMDGELIFSYPKSKDTLFKSNSRPEAQSFGAMFYEVELTASMKEAFIHDMVKHKDEWHLNFQLGRKDLLQHDQAIYDELEMKLNITSMLERGEDINKLDSNGDTLLYNGYTSQIFKYC